MPDARVRTPKPVADRRDVRSAPLSPADGFVLSRVDGIASEKDIVATTGLPDEQVQASLAKLESLALITFDGARPPAPASSDGAPSAEPDGSSPPLRAAAPRPPDPPLTPEEEVILAEEVDLDVDIRRRVLVMHRGLDRLDHYALLGVERTADRKAIKRAYFDLAAKFHPDKYFRKSLGSFKMRMEAHLRAPHARARHARRRRSRAPSTTRTSTSSAGRAGSRSSCRRAGRGASAPRRPSSARWDRRTCPHRPRPRRLRAEAERRELPGDGGQLVRARPVDPAAGARPSRASCSRVAAAPSGVVVEQPSDGGRRRLRVGRQPRPRTRWTRCAAGTRSGSRMAKAAQARKYVAKAEAALQAKDAGRRGQRLPRRPEPHARRRRAEPARRRRRRRRPTRSWPRRTRKQARLRGEERPVGRGGALLGARGQGPAERRRGARARGERARQGGRRPARGRRAGPAGLRAGAESAPFRTTLANVYLAAGLTRTPGASWRRPRSWLRMMVPSRRCSSVWASPRDG